MVDLPPELITHILTFLPTEEPETIRTLLKLTSISKSFAILALQSFLWLPIAQSTWKFGSAIAINEDPHSYVRGRAVLDRQASKSLNGMIENSTGHILRIEMIGIMANHVIDRIMRDRNLKDEENGITRRYWATESLDYIARNSACELWKRIAVQEVDTEEDFEDSVLAYEAFQPDQEEKLINSKRILSLLAIEFNSILNTGTPSSIAVQLCRQLTRLGATRAGAQTFSLISNSFLSPLLATMSINLASNATPVATRGSLPLTLVVLFCSIVSRLSSTFNIQARPVNFPGVVLAAIAKKDAPMGEEQWIFVDVADGGTILSRTDCENLMERMGLAFSEDLKPARAAEMTLRVARNLLRSVQEAQQGHHDVSALISPALYSAATALFFLSPPDPNSPYLDWIGPIIQAERSADVTRLESLLPHLSSERREQISDLCESIREEDSRVKELRISSPEMDTRQVKWRIGHVFRHKLFGYTAVIRGFDLTCLATESWIQQMQIHRLQYGRNQPFYHVIVDDGTSRYVAAENITNDHTVDIDSFNQFESIHLLGRYFRKRSVDENGRNCYVQSAELAATYPEGS